MALQSWEEFLPGMAARAFQCQPYGVAVAHPSSKEAVDLLEASFLLVL